MLRYVLRRIVMAVVIIYVVLSLSFLMVRLMPGNAMDYLQNQLERQGGLTPQQIQQKVAAIYGIQPNAPEWRQYLHYIKNAAHGDLGTSITNPGQTVTSVILNALPWTLLAVGAALIVSFVVGVSVGAIMAAFPNSWATRVMTFVVSVLSAIPNYLVAIVLIYLLADTHRILPSGGAYSVDVTPGWNPAFIGSVASHAIMPVAAYSIVAFGGWALQMKGSAISTACAEYVRAATARGLGSRRLTQSYVGRNAMLPQVTLLALSLGYMFGGSVLIEQYFNYPGIGYHLIGAVTSRDYPVMMGCFLLITVAVVISSLLVDLVYPLIDPRIVLPISRRRQAEAKAEVDEEQVAQAGGVSI